MHLQIKPSVSTINISCNFVLFRGQKIPVTLKHHELTAKNPLLSASENLPSGPFLVMLF